MKRLWGTKQLPNYTVHIQLVLSNVDFGEKNIKQQNFFKQCFNKRRYQFVLGDGCLILKWDRLNLFTDDIIRRHPTQGHENNLQKPGSHQHMLGEEAALPKWCRKLLGNKWWRWKGYAFSFPLITLVFFLREKMRSGVRYDRLRSSSAMARVLPGPLHNLWLIRHIDPKTGSTWKQHCSCCGF